MEPLPVLLHWLLTILHVHLLFIHHYVNVQILCIRIYLILRFARVVITFCIVSALLESNFEAWLLTPSKWVPFDEQILLVRAQSVLREFPLLLIPADVVCVQFVLLLAGTISESYMSYLIALRTLSAIRIAFFTWLILLQYQTSDLRSEIVIRPGGSIPIRIIVII